MLEMKQHKIRGKGKLVFRNLCLPIFSSITILQAHSHPKMNDEDEKKSCISSRFGGTCAIADASCSEVSLQTFNDIHVRHYLGMIDFWWIPSHIMPIYAVIVDPILSMRG